MPRKKLTDLFVERAAAPAKGRLEYFDASFPGLALRITDGGSKSWSVMYRVAGRLRRYTIGSYPAIKPAQARREAAEALERVRQGADPAADKKRRRDTPAPLVDTFGNVVDSYLTLYAAKNLRPATFKECKRVLESEDLKAWRDRPIGEISRRDVIDLIDGIATRAEIQANRTLALLKAFFGWATARERLTASPVAGVRPPSKEVARDRVLSDDEIRWFWTACDEIGWPFGPLAKLLLLTAQRRDEVGGIEWSEIDPAFRTWTLPARKAKNSREHAVHLSAGTRAIIESLPRTGSLIFTTTGRTSVSGFSRAKEHLDTAMIRARRAELGLPLDDAELRKTLGIPAGKPLPVEIPGWRLHDLRRTAATGMAGLNISPHVVDKILNHVSGTIRGVAAIYNKHQYLEERQAALEAWSRRVEAIVNPTTSNVVTLRG